jgi:hypothetical protein
LCRRRAIPAPLQKVSAGSKMNKPRILLQEMVVRRSAEKIRHR